MIETLRKVFDAHGGEDRWRNFSAIEATLSARGLLFAMKHVPVLDHVRIRVRIDEPRFTFLDYPRPGLSGEFAGDEVHIADCAGTIIEKRIQPRAAFRALRHLLYWDHLDFIYFGGYATWNYLMTPFLFLRSGFSFEELEPVQDPSGRLARIRVTFPDDVPTHSKTQTFFFDEQGLLRRLDYTAEVVGGWAHAAHFCDKYREFDGITFPTSRRVVPTAFGGRPLPGPTLVAIDIHELRLTTIEVSNP
jgi:hypothetical protein